MLLIKNIKLSVADEKANAYVFCDGGKIVEIGYDNAPFCENVIDGEGNILYPGLCDTHTHGAMKVDFTEATVDEILSMQDWYVSSGTTSLFPTTMTAEKEKILDAVTRIQKASELCDKLNIAGIHLEGPFLSEPRRGAHNEKLLCNPDVDFMKRVLDRCGNLKIKITVAPELDGSEKFIEYCTENGVKVSLGHSVATCEVCKKAIELGANCITHTFNGMDPLHHRKPGVLGTALSEDVYAEIICDGMHIDKQVVKLFSKAKDEDKALLVTDSVLLAGCAEGDSVVDAGGMLVKIVNGIVTNVEANCIAGSGLRFCDGVKNYMNFTGKNLDTAVKAASENAIKSVDLFEKLGSIEKGKFADFTLFDENGNLVHTIYREKIVY